VKHSRIHSGDNQYKCHVCDIETRVDVVDKSQASEIQTEADDSNVSERPHSDKPRLHR